MNLTKGVAELVGIFIGDGYIYKNHRKYQIGFVGNPLTDKELFFKIQRLIEKEWNKQSKIKIRSKGLRIVINSKDICNFLINDLGLPFGRDKCANVNIPSKIEKDWSLAKYTIRGIMDTDGTVFVSKKPGVEKYPTMEITTTSKVLADQLRKILSERGFRVGNIRASLSKTSKRIAYRVPLYGKENVKKWLKEIGFSNEYKYQRALAYSQ